MEAIGRKRWAIAEGYIPSASSFSDPALISRETACILNPGAREARVAITVFFAGRAPVGPFRVTVGARRTLHLRFNDLSDPQPIPATPHMHRCSNPTCRSSCITRGSIPAAPKSRFCQRWPMPKLDAPRLNFRRPLRGTFRIALRCAQGWSQWRGIT